VFIENPINGVGLQNFKKNATDFNFSIHSEYMVNIAEGGIIGTTLFFLFYYWIWKQLKQVFKKFKNVWRITVIYIAGFIAVLFINTAAWTYDSISVFITLGLIIGYVKQFEFLNKNHLGHHQF
jgi:O-antigen ligase